MKGVLGSRESAPTESILGSESFARGVLREVNEAERWKSEVRRKLSFTDVIERAAREAGIPASKAKGPSKVPACCRARSLACYWLVDVLGLAEVDRGFSEGASAATAPDFDPTTEPIATPAPMAPTPLIADRRLILSSS